jgi:hypothetical protein
MTSRKKITANSKKKKKPDLPDSLIYKKKQNVGNSAKDKHREEFFGKLKEEDLNPNGKEDFDKLLRGAIELGEDDLK